MIPPFRPKKALILPATRLLQSLVGFGKIKPEKIEASERKINAVKNRIDVSEFGQSHLKDIKAVLADLNNKDTENDPEITDKIAKTLMEFKGNAGMFSSASYITLAAIMLRWIESVEEIDQDVLDVLNGYAVTLDQIFNNKLTSKKQIDLIVAEMQAACERYFAKHPELQLTKVIDNDKAFYVDQSDNKNVRIGLEISDELADDELIGDDEDEKPRK